MRVLLTAMMIALLSQPAVAEKVYYCNVTDFTVIDHLAGGSKNYRVKPFKMSVSDNRVAFSQSFQVLPGTTFYNIRRVKDVIWAANSKPDEMMNFFPPVLFVAGRNEGWFALRAECEAFD